MTRSAACSKLAEKLSSLPVLQGDGFDSLELKNFTNPDRPHQEYPELHHLKAAHVRGMVSKAAEVFKPFKGQSQKDSLIYTMIKALAVVYDVMHSAGLAMTSDEFASFSSASETFLSSYTKLSEGAVEAGGYLFNIVPKFHYMCHVVEQCQYINAKMLWCYGGEDFVGR
eukprot:3731951-Alexandrium_andersonii.AAC.1